MKPAKFQQIFAKNLARRIALDSDEELSSGSRTVAAIANSLRTLKDQPEFGLCDGNILRTFAERNRSLRNNLPKFVGICSA